MAEFLTAYALTSDFEGGYSNRAADRGGETYRGISRVYWPKWQGWHIIDEMRERDDGFPVSLDRIGELRDLVKGFYETNFWDHVRGDQIEDQDIANQVYDCAVHHGAGKAGLFLQIALNAMNCRQKHYADIVEDGAIGPGTLRALSAYIKKRPPMILIGLIKCQRTNLCLSLMRKSEIQEENALGWFRRMAV